MVLSNSNKERNIIIMNISKYTKPNLPTIQHVLEDLSNLSAVQMNDLHQLSAGDDRLQAVHTCHHNFKSLEADLYQQNKLNTKLDELNKKLVENIENMKSNNKRT